MSLTLQGKVALVTGGSRGIGAAIARKLAQDGADVALTYARAADKARAVVADIEATGRRGLAIEADNNDAAAIEAAVARTAAAFGRLDVLVNNAGIFRIGPIEELTLEDFDATIAVNLRAAFVASKAAAARMGEGGRIIAIGSNLAERVPDAGLSTLQREQGGPDRPDQGPGARSRAARHHGQRRASRAPPTPT